MSDPTYEPPSIKVLGSLSELTLQIIVPPGLPPRSGTKPGNYFDYPGSSEGNDTPPPPGYPGTS